MASRIQTTIKTTAMFLINSAKLTIKCPQKPPTKDEDNKCITFLFISAEQFKRLTKAKEVLTDPESRAKYDRWKRSGISMSYEDWCALKGAVHTVSVI